MKKQMEDSKVGDVSFDDLISYIRDQNQYNVLKGVADRVQVQKEPFAKKFTARVADTSVGTSNRYDDRKSFASTVASTGNGRPTQTHQSQNLPNRNTQLSSTSQSSSRPTETGAFCHWCPSCEKNKPNSHSVASCGPFLSMSMLERDVFVFNHYLCTRCLGRGHACEDCPSTSTCQVCQGQSENPYTHHTLLCKFRPEEPEEEE